MTMPHLMNCGHSDEGHRLDCVKRDWEAAEAELTALREAVRVLGEECWMWRLTNDFVDRDTHGRYGPQKQAMAKTNANPIALAAVEKAG